MNLCRCFDPENCTQPIPGMVCRRTPPTREANVLLAHLLALVREWQEARKPVAFGAPGVGVADTYQRAVVRMAAADEALAAYDLNGPAGGALVGQTEPTESTGPYLCACTCGCVGGASASDDGNVAKLQEGPDRAPRALHRCGSASDSSGDVPPLVTDGSVMVRVDPVYVEQMRGDGLVGPFSRIQLEERDGAPTLLLTMDPLPTPDTVEWWRAVAQGLGAEIAKLKALAVDEDAR